MGREEVRAMNDARHKFQELLQELLQLDCADFDLVARVVIKDPEAE